MKPLPCCVSGGVFQVLECVLLSEVSVCSRKHGMCITGCRATVARPGACESVLSVQLLGGSGHVIMWCCEGRTYASGGINKHCFLLRPCLVNVGHTRPAGLRRCAAMTLHAIAQRMTSGVGMECEGIFDHEGRPEG